jgi:tetratricopeptide (TPR) repeat protein
MTVAYSHVASIYTDLGRLGDAIDVLSKALSQGAGNEELRTKLALALDRTGRPQRGWEVLSGDTDSRDPETQCALGRLEADLGHRDDARRRFDMALSIDPSFPQAHVDLGILHLEEGELAEAAKQLQGALAQDESLADGWNALGVVRLKEGDPRGAVEAWERAVQADPRLADALFNLALARGKMGEPALAAQALERYIPLVAGEEKRHAEDMLQQLRH